MIYDKTLYDMSKVTLVTDTKDTNDLNNTLLQMRLHKYMIEKLESELHNPNVVKDGSIKIRFYHKFFCKPDNGYNEIKELLKNNSFSEFASEYCIFLTDVEKTCDEWKSAYYELTWNYISYFNKINEEKGFQRKLINNNGGINNER